jgi:hypothetical protein
MKTPRTRAEFERNFHLLHRQIEDGKFHVARGISLDGLARVRFLPNGRIDFLSVDESARLNANMTAQSSEDWFQEQFKEKAPPEQKSDPGSGEQRNRESS